MKWMIFAAGLSLLGALSAASAQPRDTAAPTQTMRAAPAQIVQGDPAVNACLKTMLGEQRKCARTTGAARAACTREVWMACQPDTRMKAPNSIPKLPNKKPTINSKADPCKTRMQGSHSADGRATSGEKGERMKVDPPKNPLGCSGEAHDPAPGRAVAEPRGERACASCTGVCQTVSWLSGASKFDGIDVGGGQSPSQCVDKIKTQCEAGASRFMAAATCKPG